MCCALLRSIIAVVVFSMTILASPKAQAAHVIAWAHVAQRLPDAAAADDRHGLRAAQVASRRVGTNAGLQIGRIVGAQSGWDGVGGVDLNSCHVHTYSDPSMTPGADRGSAQAAQAGLPSAKRRAQGAHRRRCPGHMSRAPAVIKRLLELRHVPCRRPRSNLIQAQAGMF